MGAVFIVLGKVLVVLGIALAVIGSLLLIAIHIRRRWLSRRKPRHVTKVSGEPYVTEELLEAGLAYDSTEVTWDEEWSNHQ